MPHSLGRASCNVPPCLGVAADGQPSAWSVRPRCCHAGQGAELKKFDLEYVMPMYRSGQNFIDLAKQEMPEKLVLCGTGSSFTFTA